MGPVYSCHGVLFRRLNLVVRLHSRFQLGILAREDGPLGQKMVWKSMKAIA